jgi:membrane protein
MKETIAIVRLFIRDIERKHLMLAAAGLAYYFLMSLFPALVVVAAVMAYLPADAMRGAASFMGYVIPQPVLSSMEQLMATISPHRSGLLSAGIITTVWLASKAFTAIILGLEMVYEAREPRPFWISRLLSLGLTLAVGLLLLLGVLLALSGPFLERLFARVAPVQSLWTRVWPYVQWSLAVLVIFAALELLYLAAPKPRGANRYTIPGAAVATVIWIAIAWGFGLYLHYFGNLKLNLFFGALATPVAFMIWLYWSATAILFGAAINASLYSYKILGESRSGKLSRRATDAGEKAA